MWRDELVTLGDVLDFLEWRKRYRGVPYGFKTEVSEPPPKTLPALRFYSDSGRLYVVSRGNQLYRLRAGRWYSASTTQGFAFGNNSNTVVFVDYETYGFLVRVERPGMVVRMRIRKGIVSSLFENGYVKESPAIRSGNRVTVV